MILMVIMLDLVLVTAIMRVMTMRITTTTMMMKMLMRIELIVVMVVKVVLWVATDRWLSVSYNTLNAGKPASLELSRVSLMVPHYCLVLCTDALCEHLGLEAVVYFEILSFDFPPVLYFG
jgi:hypothetical protein